MISLDVDTRKFNKAIKKFIKESDLDATVVLKKIAFDLLAWILAPPPHRKHPVDTGRSRAAWYPSIKGLGMNYDLSKDVDPINSQVGKGKREGAFVDKSKGFTNKYVEMINGVDYIIYLEYGHSKSAPAGMVRISMRKMTGEMPKQLGKEFLKSWNKIGF